MFWNFLFNHAFPCSELLPEPHAYRFVLDPDRISWRIETAVWAMGVRNLRRPVPSGVE